MRATDKWIAARHSVIHYLGAIVQPFLLFILYFCNFEEIIASSRLMIPPHREREREKDRGSSVCHLAFGMFFCQGKGNTEVWDQQAKIKKHS